MITILPKFTTDTLCDFEHIRKRAHTCALLDAVLAAARKARLTCRSEKTDRDVFVGEVSYSDMLLQEFGRVARKYFAH